MWQAIVNYFRGSIDELKKVSWPTRQETVRYSIVVIVAIIISVGILTLVDYGLSSLVDIIFI